MSGFDFIGDIHGHHDALVSLLRKLGYTPDDTTWSHPEDRQVVFLGDYIDRGPKILETLTLVRSMVESGDAIAIMGNHEFNYIAWQTPWPGDDREWCRAHTPSNHKQVAETLAALEGQETDWMEWLCTLPPAWEADGVRAVHACWNHEAIATLQEAYNGAEGRWSTDFIREASRKGSELYNAVEGAMKGPEIALPEHAAYEDAQGKRRTQARVAWWHPPRLGEPIGPQLVPANDVVTDLLSDASPWPTDAANSPGSPLTFFGHYWLLSDPPRPLSKHAICLDYSVAKNGFLCAYQYKGESEANEHHLVWTEPTAQNSPHPQ